MHDDASLTLGAGLDRVALARLLRRAHTVTIDTGIPPQVVRKMVSDSWRRSVAAGVDPGRPAPRQLDAAGTAERLAAHPVRTALGVITELLAAELVGAGYFAAFSDADGVLLWTEGPARALATAVTPRFLPGFICSEDRVGTNAIGTALVLDHPVQIFSAEHFSELLHGWVCAAAPVHDPDTGDLLGAIDLSGEFRTGQLHSLALVAAVARAVEGRIATTRHEAGQRLVRRYRELYGSRRSRFSALVTSTGHVLVAEPHGWLGAAIEPGETSGIWLQPDGSELAADAIEDGFVVWRAGGHGPSRRRIRLRIASAGPDRVVVEEPGEGRRVALRPRHSEIVVLLAAHPHGMTVRELSQALYGTVERTRTVRAEMTRLRPVLGEVLQSRPYRLLGQVELDDGELLAASTATGIAALRGASRMQPSCSLGAAVAEQAAGD